MKSPNKERAALSMGCLLERSLPHLIPSAWKGALRRAPSSGHVASAFVQGGNSAEGQWWEARKERRGWGGRPLPTFVAKCFVVGEIIWWKLLFLRHAFVLQFPVSIILKITATVSKLRNDSSTLIANYKKRGQRREQTELRFSNSLFFFCGVVTLNSCT